MVYGTEIPSNGGQGAEQHPHDSIPEVEDVEEFFSDTSSESDVDEVDDIEVEVPHVGRRRIAIREAIREDNTRLRRRMAKAELDRNLLELRSILPRRNRTTSTVRTRDRQPVGYTVQELADMHIAQLHRNSQGALSAMEIPRTARIEGFSRENPIVEVVHENGHLNLKITCVIRAGLLIDVIAFLLENDLNMLDGSSIVNLDNAFYANLHLEKVARETPVGDCSEPRPEPRPEPQPLPLPESEEVEALKQAVIRMVRQDIPAGTTNNAN